jgi:hypothetical protein
MKLKSLLYSLGPALLRRPDLNNPPTAVGGIRRRLGLLPPLPYRLSVLRVMVVRVEP